MKATLNARLRVLGMDYRQYLRSDHWRDLKRRYRQAPLPQACVACGDPRYQLHHISYGRLGREPLTDLVPFCDNCHGAIHAYERTHPTGLWSLFRICRKVFGWSRPEAWERLGAFNVGGIRNTLGEDVPLTRKQQRREMRKVAPENPAYWTPNQRRKAGLE